MSAKVVLSIEIGHKNIRICETSYRKQKNPAVYRAVSVKTPENSILDGYIKDPKDLAVYIRRKLRVAGIKRRDVVFTITSSRVMSREVEIPFVKDGLIQQIVQAQAGEYMPMDLTDYIISHTVLERNKEEAKIKLLVFAAPKSLIEGYYTMADAMAVDVESVDYAGNSIYQWSKNIVKNKVGLALHVGEAASFATILEDGRLSVQRLIPTGTELLTSQASFEGFPDFVQEEESGLEEYASPYEETYISPYAEEEQEYVSPYQKENEAYVSPNEEEIKLEKETVEEFSAEEEFVEPTEGGFKNDEPEETLLVEEKDETTGVVRLARDELEMLGNNVSMVIDYYSSNNGGKTVDQIYITGEGALLSELEEYLKETLELPVEVNRTLTGVSFRGRAKEDTLENRASYFLPCIGATLMPLDLIPYELADFEQKKEDRKSYVVMLALVAGACVFVIVICALQYAAVKAEKKNLEKQIEAKQIALQMEEEYTAALNEYEYMSTVDALVYRNNEQFKNLLIQLEDKLPSQAEIASMTSEGPTISINFEAASKKVAAKVLLQLQQVDYIKSATTDGLIDDGKVVRFTVTCEFSDFRPEEVIGDE